MNRRYTLLLLCPLISLRHAAAKRKKKKVDGITTASTRAAPAKPGNNDHYTITGTFPGIKGAIIRYSDTLYTGGMAYSKEGFERLKKLNIKTIISFLPSPEERIAAEHYSFNLIEIKINQSEGITEKQLTAFDSAIKTAPTPVYIHCYSGMPLSAAFAARHRITTENWNKERALKEFVRLGGHLVLDQNALKNALQQ